MPSLATEQCFAGLWEPVTIVTDTRCPYEGDAVQVEMVRLNDGYRRVDTWICEWRWEDAYRLEEPVTCHDVRIGDIIRLPSLLTTGVAGAEPSSDIATVVNLSRFNPYTEISFQTPRGVGNSWISGDPWRWEGATRATPSPDWAVINPAPPIIHCNQKVE